MVDKGIDAKKLSIIYNSLNYDEQLSLRYISTSKLYQEHFSNSFYNLVFIGRLTIEKRLDLIISAMELLRKKGLQINLTIIGEGKIKNDLDKLSNDLNLDKNVWFYGPCYNEKLLSKLLYNADVCVSPGNVGLTAIHAMMYGLPVITHNEFKMQGPEFEAIVPNKTGDFFEKDSIQSLAETISSWINMEIDREEIRKNCYSIIDEKYNPHYQIKVLTDNLI